MGVSRTKTVSRMAQVVAAILCDGNNDDDGGAERTVKRTLQNVFGGLLAVVFTSTLPLCPAIGIVIVSTKDYME